MMLAKLLLLLLLLVLLLLLRLAVLLTKCLSWESWVVKVIPSSF